MNRFLDPGDPEKNHFGLRISFDALTTQCL